MELLFKVNDETKLGKVLMEVIRSFQKQDEECVKIADDKEDEFADVIFPGKPLTDDELERLTVLMESETDYITLEEARKQTLDAIRKTTGENRNKKKSGK